MISKHLRTWANLCTVFAIVFFVLSVFGWAFNSAWSDGAFSVACFSVILVPLFNGFSVLVKNAEDSLERRAKTDCMVENLEEK
jgi:hypothetical protein